MEDAAPQSGSRIFISYRREDSAGHVLALLPALRRRFGANRIFKDTDNIPPGEDFVKFIKHELESCSVLLAIIGREWLTVPDPRVKRRRLDNPDDFLRVEVGTALKHEHIRVIPVMVERATMPSPEDLPADLAQLAYRNAVELSDSRWESDVQLLIEAIERTAAPPPVAGPVPVRPELVELQKRRSREIAGHLATARQAIESQDYDAALQSCEKVLLLDPDQPDALAILDRARKTIDERKISEWLAQAQALLRKGEVGDSSDLIDQALAVDNTSETALALRREMLNYRREREREREKTKLVRAATDQARACLDDGDFEGAIRFADDALGADPDAADVRDIRTKATAAVQERRAQRELKRRAQQAASDARDLMSSGDSAGALRLLREFTPVHEVVTQALEDLQSEAVDGRRKRVDELVRQAAAAAGSRQFDRAVVLLSEAIQLEPERSDIAALLAETTKKQSAASALQRTLVEVAASFDRADYPAASQLVEAARSQDPQHPDLDGWRRRIDERLAAQAAAARRIENIRLALADAKATFAKGDLTIALRFVDAALMLDPAHAEAQAIGAQVRTALADRRAREEHERRAIEAVDHARRLFDAEDYAGALRALQSFTPAHPLVSEALTALRQDIRAIEARRRQEEEQAALRRLELERATASRERAEAVRRILARGEASLAQNDHAAAVRDADEALGKDPESAAARDLRARAQALRERLDKEAKAEKEEKDRREQERQKRDRQEQERQKRERQQQEREAQQQREREQQAREREERERKEHERIEQERGDREKKERDQRAEQTISPVERVPDIVRAEAREADEHAARPWRRVGRGWLAAAAALILATAVWYYGQTSETNPPPATTASPRNDAPAIEQPPQTRSEPSQAPPAQSPAPTEPATPPPPTTTAPPTVSNEPTEEEVRLQRLEKLRETARGSYQAGRRLQALNATEAALALAPGDVELKSIRDRILGDASKAAQQSKSKAIAVDAPALAKETYGRGLKLEDDGNRSRVQDAPAATRSFWRAAEGFDAAAREATETAQKLARSKQPDAQIVKPPQQPPSSGGGANREAREWKCDHDADDADAHTGH